MQLDQVRFPVKLFRLQLLLSSAIIFFKLSNRPHISPNMSTEILPTEALEWLSDSGEEIIILDLSVRRMVLSTYHLISALSML